MQQLSQNLLSGTMSILEVPFPALDAGTVLVRNHYSAISAGTEGKTVADARLNPIGKAQARKKEVRQVLDLVRTNGLARTYAVVMNRLHAPSTLGYSCAGEVLAVGSRVRGIRSGQRVACAGAAAVHAEVVAVPENLCVVVPETVSLRHAALATHAAIAMQGIRRAELDLASNCVVIGLGMIGLLTVQLLKAASIRVVGIDIEDSAVARAAAAGADLALSRSEPGLQTLVQSFTRGHGADAVIITAATTSLDPVELAGHLCRRKGRVVIVGAVPTGFTRDQYYRKELDLRMSCSYGPGRYDPSYEQHGVDYPIGYVRWTENRNMQAYIDLLASARIDPEPLITHTFPFERAADAYRLILARTQPFGGILLEYDVQHTPPPRLTRTEPRKKTGLGYIGFIGAGAFAQDILLPAAKRHGKLIGVVTARPSNARKVAQKWRFEYCAEEYAQLLADDRIDTIFIATRHDLHAPMVLDALRAGKHVFVEKPLCLTPEQLSEIRLADHLCNTKLMVGFNRRFAPLIRRLQKRMPRGLPMAINYRINAGALPSDHWVHDPVFGGGRIIGEFCHFIDLVTYLVGAPIESVHTVALDDPHRLNDTFAVTLRFRDGSIAALSYMANGSKSVPKEQIEVFCDGSIAILDDFTRLTIHRTRVERATLRKQDKGHNEEVARFLTAIREGHASPIPFTEIEATMLATFAVRESLLANRAVTVGR